MLRQDNADRRLTALGREVGLISEQRWQTLQTKEAAIVKGMALLRSGRKGEVSLEKYLRRPEVEWAECVGLLPDLAEFTEEVANQIMFDVKYEGYVGRQQLQVARQHRLAEKRIPDSFDYRKIQHLRTEAREKLIRVRPLTIAHASRISGITPADVALVMAYLE